MGCSSSATSGNKPGDNGNKVPTCTKTIKVENIPTCLTSISDKDFLIAFGNEIKKIEITSEKITPAFNGHEKEVNCIIKLSNGLFASASQDRTIKIWDLDSSTCKGTLEGHKSIIWSICECTNHSLLSVGDDKKAMIWNINKYSLIDTLTTAKTIITSCISLKDDNVLIGCESLKVFNIKRKKMLFEINLGFPVWSILQLNSGRIATGLGNGEINLVDLDKQESILKINGHSLCVNCLAELSGDRIISGSDDNNLNLWNYKSNQEKIPFKDGHNSPVVGLVKVNDFKLVSASEDSIKIWQFS